tara:strand:+ start:26 stop:262 length:237 start_codon:yes stop_codon:yes gene_type:complete
MSKTKLRKEYEARFGDADDALKLYDDKGNVIYHEDKFGVFIDGRVEFTAGWKPAKDITRNLILSGGLTESLRANRIVT